MSGDTQHIWKLLEAITDPEVPVLTIVDLGIIRKVEWHDEKVIITITPTYSGCPAMDIISMQIRMQLLAAGYKTIEIAQQLQPAWTTDWMSESGKEKLEAYGIAAPWKKAAKAGMALFENENVKCPKCKSEHTEIISGFSGTSCKALYRCLDCKEPFEYFKCH